MKRRGWSVFAVGLLLALFGLYGMWVGWDQILLERGWSQFIGGATAVSGGVVTMALGRVIDALGELADLLGAKASRAAGSEAAPAIESGGVRESGRSESSAQGSPVEVDRYVSNGAVYVMFSDGSVEVHSEGRAQRYPSLAALRADAGIRRR